MKVHRRLHIIVIDDDPEVLSCFRSIFEPRDVDLYRTISSISAIEECKRHTYDIAYIDLYMPVMNGIETMLHLKELNPQISVFMISGFRNPHMLESAIRSGAQDYLFKPLHVQDILAKTDALNSTVTSENGSGKWTHRPH